MEDLHPHYSDVVNQFYAVVVCSQSRSINMTLTSITVGTGNTKPLIKYRPSQARAHIWPRAWYFPVPPLKLVSIIIRFLTGNTVARSKSCILISLSSCQHLVGGWYNNIIAVIAVWHTNLFIVNLDTCFAFMSYCCIYYYVNCPLLDFNNC